MAYKKEYSKAGKKYTTDKKPAYKPKRGPLSKLMTEEMSGESCPFDIKGTPKRTNSFGTCT